LRWILLKRGGTLFHRWRKSAVTIKKRFSDEIIELLLKLQWWNWDEKKIFRNLDELVSAKDIVTLKNFIT